MTESFYSLVSGDEECVSVDGIDLSEGFDEIGCVAFVATKSSPNRVGVNCYSQVACGSLMQNRASVALRLFGTGAMKTSSSETRRASSAGAAAMTGSLLKKAGRQSALFTS